MTMNASRLLGQKTGAKPVPAKNKSGIIEEVVLEPRYLTYQGKQYIGTVVNFRNPDNYGIIKVETHYTEIPS